MEKLHHHYVALQENIVLETETIGKDGNVQKNENYIATTLSTEHLVNTKSRNNR